jgi:hypothetical protein
MPMAYLINSKHEFDSFVFGNSKLNKLNVLSLGESWYRLNYNAGRPSEHLYNAKLLIKKGINVKSIILTATSYHIFHPIAKDPTYNGFLYPNTFQKWYEFYRENLIKKLDKKDVSLLLNTKFELKNIKELAVRNNKIKVSSIDVYKNTNDKIINIRPKIKEYDKNHSNDFIKIVKELVELCSKNNINFKLIFLPSHYKPLLSYDIKKINKTKRKLINITDFYDFSLPHNFIVNNDLWREDTHYASLINFEIIKFITENKLSNTNIGKFVTKENINNILNESYFTTSEIKHLQEYDRNLKVNDGYTERANTFKRDFNIFKSVW